MITIAFKGYAGFWKRLAAAIIDGMIVIGLAMILKSFFLPAPAEGGEELFAPAEVIKNLSTFSLILLFSSWIYYGFMESSSGQATLGKMTLGIKVIDRSGKRISFFRATGRYWGKFLSTFPFFIGFLMIAFSGRKQALHDKISGCLVVNG